MVNKQFTTGFSLIISDSSKSDKDSLRQFSVLSVFLHAAVLTIFLIWNSDRLKLQPSAHVITVDLSQVEEQLEDLHLPKTASTMLPMPTSTIRTNPVPIAPTAKLQLSSPTTAASTATAPVVSIKNSAQEVPSETQVRTTKSTIVQSYSVAPNVQPSQAGLKTDTAGISTAYMHRCRSMIERYKEYPVMARKGRIEGTVVIRSTLTRDGLLRQCNISRTSGSKLLDNAALRAVQTVERFPPVPTELQGNELVFELPISFRLSIE